MPTSNGQRVTSTPHGPDLMTEAELIQFLRIPAVTKAANHSNVVRNLKQRRGLPCMYISKQPLYWRPAIEEWLQRQMTGEQHR